MIDFNDDIIVYAIYKGSAHWYVSYKGLWYLNYNLLINAYSKKGYTIDLNMLDEIRRDLLEMSDEQIPIFLERLKKYIWSNHQLADEFRKNLSDDCMPSLFVDFDKKYFISMYRECVSFEDYMPVGWKSEYDDFLHLIPRNDAYWDK